MGEYKYIGKEMILDVIKARGRYLGDAEIMNSMDKTALDQIEGYKKALDSIAEDVENIPPVNVQPVKRGAWRKDEQGYDVYVECSECGLNLSISNYIENEWRETLKYCPRCGARMD